MHFYGYYLQKKETHNFFKEEMKILHSEGNIKQRSFGFFHDNELCKNEVRKQCTKSTVLFFQSVFSLFCQGFSSVILETQLSAMQVRIEFPSSKKSEFLWFQVNKTPFFITKLSSEKQQQVRNHKNKRAIPWTGWMLSWSCWMDEPSILKSWHIWAEKNFFWKTPTKIRCVCTYGSNVRRLVEKVKTTSIIPFVRTLFRRIYATLTGTFVKGLLAAVDATPATPF